MSKKKILVADDDPSICEGIAMILEDAGYEVKTTTDGRTVRDVKKFFPNLILLDIWMSGVDGREICQRIKKETVTKNIPIIMISANRDTEQMARECGADGFIAKPFEMKNLLGTVKKFTQ